MRIFKNQAMVRLKCIWQLDEQTKPSNPLKYVELVWFSCNCCTLNSITECLFETGGNVPSQWKKIIIKKKKKKWPNIESFFCRLKKKRHQSIDVRTSTWCIGPNTHYIKSKRPHNNSNIRGFLQLIVRLLIAL